MRHRLSGRQLNRDATARAALFNNLVTALITYGRIETTEAKAKELGRYAEPIITLGIGVSDLVAKGDKATKEETSKVLHAVRQARHTVMTKDALHKLFHEVAPHFKTRKGGYTRVLKTRTRKGDAAPMAFIELVGMNGQPTA